MQKSKTSYTQKKKTGYDLQGATYHSPYGTATSVFNNINEVIVRVGNITVITIIDLLLLSGQLMSLIPPPTQGCIWVVSIAIMNCGNIEVTTRMRKTLLDGRRPTKLTSCLMPKTMAPLDL